MYDLMMIDDDKAIRNHLKSMIAFERLPIRLVCEAGDSETAQELFSLHRPKIVITDIKIPIRSGLELAMEWRKIDPEIRFIVVTGYNDITYAREAVSLGAVELLLKPLVADDVNQSLEKAIAYFEQIRQEKLNALSMESLLMDNLPLLQRQYASLLLNPLISKDSTILKKRLRLLEMNLTGTKHAVIYVSVFQNGTVPDDIEATAYRIKAVCDDLLSDQGYNSYSFYDDSYILQCIVSWNQGGEKNTLEDCVGKLHEDVFFLFGIKLYAGIGIPVEVISDLPVSAAQAQLALESLSVSDSDAVADFRNMQDTPFPFDQEQSLDQMHRLFRAGELAELSEMMNETFDTFQTEGQPDSASAFAYKYVSILLSDMSGYRLPADHLQDYAETMAEIFTAESVEALKAQLMRLTVTLLGAMSRTQSERKNGLILAAQQYINENLGNRNMSLSSVSQHIGLSEVYFCRLFRKETGITFSEYLNRQRIEKAKSLLADVSKRVSEVSYEVGYDQPKYFNYVFKKLVGSAPLEYRRSLASE